MAAESQIIRLSVKIDATFGSEIQRDVSMNVLKEFLQAWKTNVEEANKKNRVVISE